MLAPDRLLEDDRFAGMCRDQTVDEGDETLLYEFVVGVREGVEHVCVGIDIHEYISEVLLHLAVSAASKREDLEARMPHELKGIGHSRAADADSLGETRAVEEDAVAECPFERFDGRVFLDSHLAGIDLRIHREIENAFVHLALHVADHDHLLVILSLFGVAGSCPGPLSLGVLDVEVVSAVGQRHRVGCVVELSPLGLDRYDAGVGLEKDHQAGRGTYLTVLACGESLIFDCIHAGVGIGGAVEDLARQVEVGSLCVIALNVAGGGVVVNPLLKGCKMGVVVFGQFVGCSAGGHKQCGSQN